MGHIFKEALHHYYPPVDVSEAHAMCLLGREWNVKNKPQECGIIAQSGKFYEVAAGNTSLRLTILHLHLFGHTRISGWTKIKSACLKKKNPNLKRHLYLFLHSRPNKSGICLKVKVKHEGTRGGRNGIQTRWDSLFPFCFLTWTLDLLMPSQIPPLP